jgi:GNAT superfamily N-acetyltransferase
MPPDLGSEPLSYRRIGRADLGDINQLELDPDQVERYLGPVPEILAAVRRGPAHSLVGIEAAGGLVGFFVLNPDPRDASCWWLGWFSMDRRVQGRGYGSETMREIMRRLRCIGCRRARLLVVPGNPAATLYERMGFRTVGEDASEGCLVMEVVLRAASWAATAVQAMSGALTAWSRRGRRRMRLRLSPGPHAAMVIGVERGPPFPA